MAILMTRPAQVRCWVRLLVSPLISLVTQPGSADKHDDGDETDDDDDDDDGDDDDGDESS